MIAFKQFKIKVKFVNQLQKFLIDFKILINFSNKKINFPLRIIMMIVEFLCWQEYIKNAFVII